MTKITIYEWIIWKELCEKNGLDPYENITFEGWRGGGVSKRFDYVGDIPERKEKK